jgi:hypothetical protein
MTEQEGSRLRLLLDREEIRDCISRYARGVDRLDNELVRSAFHIDAVDCHGPLCIDREEFIAAIRPLQAGREFSQHFVANQTIDLDEDTAHVETYFIVTFKMRNLMEVEVRGGRYVDRFERRDGIWRISVRVVVIEWTLMGDASSMSATLQVNHRGTRDRADVSYERPLVPRRL